MYNVKRLVEAIPDKRHDDQYIIVLLSLATVAMSSLPEEEVAKIKALLNAHRPELAKAIFLPQFKDALKISQPVDSG